jgi:hypothetical protein
VRRLQAARGHGSGPYLVMTRAQMRAGLDLLPTWALEQKAAANRQVIAVMRKRLAAPPARPLLACTRSRDWDGWRGKQKSPKSWSRSGSERKRTGQEHDRTGWDTRTLARYLKGCLMAAALAV